MAEMKAGSCFVSFKILTDLFCLCLVLSHKYNLTFEVSLREGVFKAAKNLKLDTEYKFFVTFLAWIGRIWNVSV